MLPKFTASLRRYNLVVIATLTLFALIPTAFASTVLQLDMQSLVANSDQIVVGRVTELNSYLEQDGRVYTAITIDVDESLKGQPDQQIVIRQIGGRTDELSTIVPGMPDFKPQEEVILFLELHQLKNKDIQVPVITGMSQGKFSVAIGPDDSTRFVVPHLGDLNQIQPAQRTQKFDDNTPRPDLKSIDTSTIRKVQNNDLYRKVVEINAFKQQIKDVINEQIPQ